MSFHFRRQYRGPLQGVILDWAGTTIDYGCCAPAAVFIEVFRNRGIEVTQRESREPMGMAKREHIRQITLMPSVARQWRHKYGTAATEADIDAIYREFIPANWPAWRVTPMSLRGYQRSLMPVAVVE